MSDIPKLELENDYGKELVLDLHECDADGFTRRSIELFFIGLCELIDMEREVLHFWDYVDHPKEYENAPDHLKGTSAIQFISTSNITLHSLDVLKRVYINIFSCKDFDENSAMEFSKNWFKGRVVNSKVIRRI